MVKGSLAEAVRCFFPAFGFLAVVYRCYCSSAPSPCRAELGNQAKDMFGGEILKAQPIHSIADCHIAGEMQQAVIHFLWPQFRLHGAGRENRKKILPFSDRKVPIPHLLFDVLLRAVKEF